MKVMKAVMLGDLSKQIEVDAHGEILDLKNTVHGLVVCYKGYVGGWKSGQVGQLYQTLKEYSSRLQVGAKYVTKAMVLGDLSKLVNVDMQDKVPNLKMTVNSMVAHLSMLVNEVTKVSLEVRMEGILGGQLKSGAFNISCKSEKCKKSDETWEFAEGGWCSGLWEAVGKIHGVVNGLNYSMILSA
ncbi:hypothetical protein L208DRAFT_1382570 [Tricholoma matsutake]|nr:hypothetical protein L208DRAFT_1382570 [Tricholoma matsutake 945]